MEEEVEEERFQQGELHDADVKAWSDFLKVHLHPTSVIELPFWSFNEPFSTFAAGVSKSTISAEHRDNYFDTVRQFAEECDYLRNITVLADLHDGFGGLTCSLMEEIRDEFPRMTVVREQLNCSNMYVCTICNMPGYLYIHDTPARVGLHRQ